MLTDRQLAEMARIYEERMLAVSEEYFVRMGAHLKALGQLSPSDVHRLIELRRVGTNVDAIQNALARAAGKTASEVEELFMQIAEKDYRFQAQYYEKGRQIPIRQNAAMMKIIKAQAKQTTASLVNLSNTTVVSKTYKKAVDKAVQAVHSGVADYHSAIRETLRAAGQEGLRVEYESGYSRRLDSALRQNILDGARQLQANVMQQTGHEFGADGVEISAHTLCANDHLPYQGQQYSDKEFGRLQAILDRPIGEWNCRHVAIPIVLGVSQPAYSDEMLASYRENSTEDITIDGLTKSRYDWTQEMRKIETAVRYQKDTAILAKASGDMQLRREVQANINRLDTAYGKMANKIKAPAERERMAVAGFRPVKAAAGGN